jgi:hypothetical protein
LDGPSARTATSYIGIGSSFQEPPDLVENIEIDLGKKEVVENNNWSGTSCKSTSQDLARKIRVKFQKTPSHKDDFLPIDELDRLITGEVIGKELRRHQQAASLVDQIWDIGPQTSP